MKWVQLSYALEYICGQHIVADMRKVLAKHPSVEQQRLHRRVFFDNIDPENQALLVNMCFLFWCGASLLMPGVYVTNTWLSC